MSDDGTLRHLDVPLERDIFMRRMLRELTGTLEDVVGMEDAAGYVSTVGAALGHWIDEQYRKSLSVDTLNIEQLAKVFVDLKERIGGKFTVESIDADKIVVMNTECPFGHMAEDRLSMCMMTSNVFGRIAANNLGYARVALEDTIAQRSKHCRIVVYLQPQEGHSSDEREYYRTLEAAQ